MDKKEIEIEQQKLDNTIQKIEDRSYFVWELLDNKNQLFRKQTNSVGDGIAYKTGLKESQILEKAKEEPYFGRFDIVSEEEGEETFYIGKQGVRDTDENIVVVDWRMPIASVFYNFTPGKPYQTYVVDDVNTGKKTKNPVEVRQKREFTIKNKVIKKIIQEVSDRNSKENVTLTQSGEELSVNDNFLKELLESTETTGYLKEIIATIQKEQDLAIRQPIDTNVIIQGVAGSGKSSIALHRLSFLMFNNKHLKPEEFLIIGPSQMFISSIKELLPELNLDGIQQKTFQQLFHEIISDVYKKKIDTSINWYFENLLFNETNEIDKKRIAFKGSEELTLVLDIYVEEIINNFENNLKNLSIMDEFLTIEDQVKIFNGYSYLPFGKKLERFILHVVNHFKGIEEKRLKVLEEEYQQAESFIKNGGLTSSEQKQVSTKLKSVYEYKSSNLKNNFKNAITSWKNTMKLPDIVTIYKQMLSYEILQSFEHEIGSDNVNVFKNYKLNTLTYFDLPALLYIYLLIYGHPKKYSHIIVDEAQDFSYMHFAILKKLTKTMTILGDIGQSIYVDYGQNNWEGIMDKVLNKNKDSILSLETSYRSTKQIIDVANTVLDNHYGIFHNPITSINRNGGDVTLESIASGEELLNKINTTIKEWKKKYKRIAIIHKDEPKAKRVAKYLKDVYKSDVEYISPEQDVTDQSISVLASYYSKGMEFDAVMLLNINEVSFPKDDLHARLLYVLVTRAQHELKMFYEDSPTELLDGLLPERPKVASRFDDIL